MQTRLSYLLAPLYTQVSIDIKQIFRLHITYYILHITYYILHITYYILHITYYILHITNSLAK